MWISIDNPLDSNVAAGLWSTVEVQVGFICANLPHSQHLMIRCFQRWRPHSGRDRSNTDDYRTSSNAQSRSRRYIARFQNLGSHNKSASEPVAERAAESGVSSHEEASFGGYDSDYELPVMGAPGESRMGKVEVRTEVRQEVQRIEGPRVSGPGRVWGNDSVPTEISAQGSGF